MDWSARDPDPGRLSDLRDEGIHLLGPVGEGLQEVLTVDAVRFVADLSRKFESRRRELLARRLARQIRLDDGELPDFLEETELVRTADWTVAPIPADLMDRRVEITGPVSRKMVINALNSGANVFMADFEDSSAPTWSNMVDGQLNLFDAVRRQIEFVNPDGRVYRLDEQTATLMVRPRGWHLEEKHLLVDEAPVSGSLFDFGLFFYHNARELMQRGSGPYFYLPKLENHLEARLWNDVFVYAQEQMQIPQGTIRATVLIETILAAFEMDEILYELREHSAGLNCGRWDYIFSFIKRLGRRPEFVLPDRDQVTMERHFLKSYSELAVRTCHRRGIHAIGGMAAQIPIKFDEEANSRAIEKVRGDKLREVKAGHDGTWVAHPGLVSIARSIFDIHMSTPNQIHVGREDVRVDADDLLAVPTGSISEQGLRKNVNIAIRYLEAWLSGVGCVPLNHLMEDAATAEISRTQVWQWVFHQTEIEGNVLTPGRVAHVVVDELNAIRETVGEERYRDGKFVLAGRLLKQMMTEPHPSEFMTLLGYEHLE